ncbi:MAG: aldolase/citrate lyase family protein [Ilumatobacter sp.]|uniref:HpcH/HpaI aldolase family protein n=1 Tax=Ilumatobacter sp. TaxID=1967498 RepID=UPI00263165DE|nr:aldolase/citrate lyase family protein [Ilumatobacter sp.]MDJ0769359.1 aldolase/citrate lyase family protein [Ilumatobacter sp.]
MSTLRETWAAGGETLGLWLSLPTTVSAEATALQPVDYVCIDTQHGAIDYQASVSMIQAIELGGGTPIVRVPWNEPGIIGKTLDAGAHGVIVPMVNDREQAEAVVRAARYVPDGARSWGPVMAAMRHADNRSWAAETIAVIPMIETGEAVSNLDDILTVPGIDAIYVGPADLAISLGLGPAGNEGDPVFDGALETIVAACRRHGVVPGIHSTGALTPLRRAQGFRMITVTSDALAMRAGYASELAASQGEAAGEESGDLY